MQINGREISYLGNNDWHVDGQHAVVAAWDSSDLRVPATGERIALTAEQASSIRAERDAEKAARQAPVTPRRATITEANLAYHMYDPRGRLFG